MSTGLARLGVRAAIVSRVGDDGHGLFVRDFLESEGIDTRFLAVDGYWLTPPTFCEIWPPDDFPITFYRRPSVPDWQLQEGTSTPARSPRLRSSSPRARASRSRRAARRRSRRWRRTPGTTMFDLDWRPSLWDDAGAYRDAALEAAGLADVVIGNDG